MGGWLAYILLNLGTSSGPALVATGWDSLEYLGSDELFNIDPDQTLATN